MDDQLPSDGGGATGPAGTVLVCDYTGRRPEAPVSSLRLESHGYTVHYLLDPPHVRQATATAYVEELIRRHGPFDRDVRAVLAYCTAAPIAQDLATAIAARTGAEIPLVLFDGKPATAQAIEEQYVFVGGKLGGALDLCAEDLTPPPAFDAATLRERPDEALRRMREGLLQMGEWAVARGTGEPNAVRADAEAIADFSLDWLSHLVAAHNTAWPTWGGPAVQVASDEHDCAPEWPGATSTRTVRIGTTRRDLLLHPDVAATVLSILQKGFAHAS